MKVDIMSRAWDNMLGTWDMNEWMNERDNVENVWKKILVKKKTTYILEGQITNLRKPI